MGRQNERTGSLGCGHSRGLFWVPGGPIKSVGGNVGGISVSGGELVPGGLQQSDLGTN